MREEKVAVRLDRCYLGVVFDRELENIPEPIEICSPDLLGNPVDAIPCVAAEFRLVPGADGEAWDAEIDAEDLLGCPQLLHPGKTAPRSLQSAWTTVYDPYVGYALELQAEGGGKSALACADDQHVKHLGAVTGARQSPLSRGIAHICQLAPHPIRELDDAHGPCPLTKPQTRACPITAVARVNCIQ